MKRHYFRKLVHALNPFDNGRKRSFEGAKGNRLTADFESPITTADAEIFNNLILMRSRCRQLERNSSTVSRICSVFENNVLKDGVGFSMQMKIKDPSGKQDDGANNKIEEAWSEWCGKKYCTVAGDQSFYDVLRQCLRRTGIDGSSLIKKYTGTQFGKFGFAIQPLEIDLLDHYYTAPLSNGNHVVMGIEKDELERIQRYWMLKNHPGQTLFFFNNSMLRYSVPADDLIHFFIKDRPTQSLGVPWLSTAILTLHHLNAYEQAELIAAREAAIKGGFFRSDQGDAYTGQDITTPNDTSHIDTADDLEPGQKTELPAGMDFIPYDPKHPTDAFDPFCKSMMRKIAGSQGLAYESVSGDVSDANYSSLRAWKKQEEETFKRLQATMIEHICYPIFESWLEASLLSGAITLPFSKFDKFHNPLFRGRRWSGIDPQKEVTAALMAIQGLLMSRTQYTEEYGENFEEVLDQLEAEKELADSKGLVPVAPNLGGALPEHTANGQNKNPPSSKKRLDRFLV